MAAVKEALEKILECAQWKALFSLVSDNYIRIHIVEIPHHAAQAAQKRFRIVVAGFYDFYNSRTVPTLLPVT